MKKILLFVITMVACFGHVSAAVRDGNSVSRGAQKRVATVPTATRTTTARSTVLNSERNITGRAAITSKETRVRANTVVGRTAKASATAGARSGVIARAAADESQSIDIETRTGAAYETCKSAFFTCMDQFCTLKNDDYRRCSCSKRVASIDEQRSVLTEAGEQLTVFTENIGVVGLTAAQATAMRTASDGELALAEDTSKSKALLQAIMNSISGGDTTVSGKYSDLNTINMSYDLSVNFGSDANQIIASYNGQELYTAVYSQCRNAVNADCNKASLQRAVNAYLMAIEQDCNTVQTAIDEKRAQMKSAVREGSAMLDLARVENRQKHNASDKTTCMSEVESAILSEEVCGAGYHKCLDNGEFIDVSTGAPIAGVIRFYELGNLLTFAPGVDAANQQLAKRASNRTFVSNFEQRTKKFALPALDKCVEIADEVWSEYLDRAMLTIYYAQQSKVQEIKQGCFDFVSQCYSDNDVSITKAMSELVGSSALLIEPNRIELTTKMCTDYVDSCNNMFDGDIVTEYVNNQKDTDIITACRVIVKQCFDKYGGTGYENFYYPYSGLSKTGRPGDWFTLYDHPNPKEVTTGYVSPCAIELTTVAACNSPEIIEKAFGGFDRMYTVRSYLGHDANADRLSFYIVDKDTKGMHTRYGLEVSEEKMRHRVLRPVGVATDVYNQVIDTLVTQCSNIDGGFVEYQFVRENLYGGKQEQDKDFCLWYPPESDDSDSDVYKHLAANYLIGPLDSKDFLGENMCPRDYALSVDTSFWGICSCWENGARRSKNGTSAICVAELPTADTTSKPEDKSCINSGTWTFDPGNSKSKFDYWCTQTVNGDNQVCPYGYMEDDYKCKMPGGGSIDTAIQDLIPKGRK